MRRLRAVFLGSYLLPNLVLGQQSNILTNGNFENGLMCYNAYIWSGTGQAFRGDYTFTLSTDARSAPYSLEIRCPSPDMDCFKAAIVSDRIQTPPGQAHKLTLQTKCPSGRAAAVYVPGTQGGDTFQYLTCNGEWAPNQINFTSGSANDFFFYVYNRDVEWLRIDDMVLTYADGTVPPQQPVLHAGKRNVSISGQTVLVDGAPYFPLGFFDVYYEDLAQAASLGANTLLGVDLNMGANCFNTSRTNYLDRAYDLGLNFIPHSVTTTRLKVPDLFPALLAKYTPHLANIGWFLADEPDQTHVVPWYIPAPNLLAAYQAAKPHTSLPIFSVFQRPSWAPISETEPYVGSADIWVAEPYGPDFSTLKRAVNTFNQLKRQPIWLAQDGWFDTSLIVPKAYWAAIHGATGIFYFNWNEFRQDAGRLSAASQVFRELKQLKDVIFATPLDSQVTPPEGIGATARSYNGSTYILSANPVDTVVNGNFQVQGLAAGTPVSVLFENRTITANAGGFTDTFQGVSRHVYVIPTATVTTVPVTINSVPSALALTIDGVSCVTPCARQWTAGSTHTVAASEILGPTAPAPGTRYVFSSWSDGGSISHTVTTPASTWTLSAQFTVQHQLSTAVTPAGAGNVIPATGWVNGGSVLSISATANSGYQFGGFTGSLSGSVTPQMLSVTGPATVNATFLQNQVSGWYDAFARRRKITINRAKVAGTLANFPVLVALTDAEMKTSALGGYVTDINGNDIVFTAADGLTKLNHEIDAYSASDGGLVAWVQVPILTPAADIDLYVYYGKAGSAPQQNRPGVWDTAYRAVHHFQASAASDSTQYGNSAIPSGTAALIPTGQIGSAFSVDGLSGQLSIPYSPSWNASFTSFTLEFWFKPGQLRDYTGAIALGGWGSPVNAWVYANDTIIFRLDSTSGYCGTSGVLPLDGAFHHVALSFDGTRSTLDAFIDGVGRPYPYVCSGSTALPQRPLTIGRFENGAGVQASFDELRISAGTARTAAWITTGFTNQKSPATFYTVGAPEGTALPVTTVSTNPIGLMVTVDGTDCTAPCTFRWVPGSVHTVAAATTLASPVSGTRYAFASWSDAGAQSHSLTAPSTSGTFTANFLTQHLLTTGANPSTSGSVTPATGWFTSGTTLSVSAIAAAGSQFSGFTGALTGLVSPQSFGITGPATITAAFTSTTTPSNWYSSWTNRRKLTIDRTKIAGNLQNFPVLVSLSSTDLKPVSLGGKMGKMDGTDLLFTGPDGTSKLAHEIESYDPSSGSVIAWVQVPVLSQTADPVLYLYYGNTTADQQNRPGVWDTAYRAVHHFKASPASDSTQYGNSAIPSGAAALIPAGQIGSAFSVDGLTGQLSIPYSPSWNASFSSFTLEFWFKPGQLRDYAGAIAMGGWGSPVNAWVYANGTIIFRLDSTSGYCGTSGVLPLDGAFHHVALSFDGTRSTLDAFIDGVGRPYPYVCSGSTALPQRPLTIGRFENGAGVQASFDELRISAGTARTAAWITTGFTNQKSPATFYTVGAMEVRP